MGPVKPYMRPVRIRAEIAYFSESVLIRGQIQIKDVLIYDNQHVRQKRKRITAHHTKC